MLTTYTLAARAIKRRVDAFSDLRLNDGDDVWHAREVELRCAVAATANAIAVEFADNDPAFDLLAFATTCGLYVSDGRDNYSDCHPGELTWERPRTEAAEVAQSTTPVTDHDLAAALPEYNGWQPSYEYPGFICYAHPAHVVMVCASSDFNGDGKLDVQIQTADGAQIFDDGENAPWPHEGRTAEKLFARLRPYLDKYQPPVSKSQPSPKES